MKRGTRADTEKREQLKRDFPANCRVRPNPANCAPSECERRGTVVGWSLDGTFLSIAIDGNTKPATYWAGFWMRS